MDSLRYVAQNSGSPSNLAVRRALVLSMEEDTFDSHEKFHLLLTAFRGFRGGDPRKPLQNVSCKEFVRPGLVQETPVRSFLAEVG